MSAHHMGRLASRPQEAVRGLISLTAMHTIAKTLIPQRSGLPTTKNYCWI